MAALATPSYLQLEQEANYDQLHPLNVNVWTSINFVHLREHFTVIVENLQDGQAEIKFNAGVLKGMNISSFHMNLQAATVKSNS